MIVCIYYIWYQKFNHLIREYFGVSIAVVGSWILKRLLIYPVLIFELFLSPSEITRIQFHLKLHQIILKSSLGIIDNANNYSSDFGNLFENQYTFARSQICIQEISNSNTNVEALQFFHSSSLQETKLASLILLSFFDCSNSLPNSDFRVITSELLRLNSASAVNSLTFSYCV